MGLIKVGIVGAAGYTGGELIRILLYHPFVEIAFAYSNSQADRTIASVHTDLVGETDLRFTSKLNIAVDVVFMCMAHGEVKYFIEKNPFSPTTRIIDLSQDFRPESHKPDSVFTYGLPELYRERIATAKYIANPGCFATAILLALAPAASAGLLPNEIHINATTGSTGAGQSLTPTSQFSWRNGNFSVYKAFEHQHQSEISQCLESLQGGNFRLNFIPNRGNFARGILASIYFDTPASEEECQAIYASFYEGHPFTHISVLNPNLKMVVNTNKCVLYLAKHGSKLLIISILDNLIKGASGQAVQNMNIMFALPEKTGLNLKPSAY